MELISREELHEADNAADSDNADDEAVEYKAWKRRELSRIERDRGENDNDMVSSHLTHEEHPEHGLGNLNDPLAPPNKNKRKFFQKYYHKGCFFQYNADDARQTTRTCSTFSRDFSAPTGEDNMNKAILPKVMQVRNFGRRGRTKWTHLVNEDTTYV